MKKTYTVTVTNAKVIGEIEIFGETEEEIEEKSKEIEIDIYAYPKTDYTDKVDLGCDSCETKVEPVIKYRNYNLGLDVGEYTDKFEKELSALVDKYGAHYDTESFEGTYER
jgi:hypothetical protein